MCYTSYSTTAGMAYNLVSLLSLVRACFACPNYISLYKLVDSPNLGSGRGLCLSHLHSAPNHIVIVPMPTPASWPFEHAPQLCVLHSLCTFHCLCHCLACGGFVSSLSGHWAESEKRTGTIRMVMVHCAAVTDISHMLVQSLDLAYLKIYMGDCFACPNK